MNVIEMQKACDVGLDKANSPWYSSDEKDYYLNKAQFEFAETRHTFFEKDERIRKELLPLVRVVSAINTSTVNYSAVPEFMFTLSISGVFNKVCGEGTSTQSVHPLQLDDEFMVEKDPFNKSADDNPNYIEENTGVDSVAIIKSDTTPLSYTLKYLNPLLK